MLGLTSSVKSLVHLKAERKPSMERRSHFAAPLTGNSLLSAPLLGATEKSVS